MRKLKTARPTLDELTAGLSAASGCTAKQYEEFLQNMQDAGLRFESIKYQLPNPASVPLPPPPPPPRKKTPAEMSPPFTMAGVGRKI